MMRWRWRGKLNIGILDHITNQKSMNAMWRYSHKKERKKITFKSKEILMLLLRMPCDIDILSIFSSSLSYTYKTSFSFEASILFLCASILYNFFQVFFVRCFNFFSLFDFFYSLFWIYPYPFSALHLFKF